jgi:membrane complex biogenesis BtpA family protein
VIGPLIGMVHLGPLPGSPGYASDLDRLVVAAVADAAALADAGFDALLVENFGDGPFFADDVPKATVAAMTRAVAAVRAAVDLPVGVNVLRNDALAAVAVAAATGASFIRVNVLSGSMVTDQGPIVGRAAAVARLRSSLHTDVAVLADVMVKHAVAPPGLTLAAAARDTWERAGADGLVVSGPGTGAPTGVADLDTVRAEAPGAPLYVGSGATRATVATLLDHADGVIVGTDVKRDGVTTAPVDPARAADLVAAARR